MEQNKLRTYLLYAVGEIALVMIGILLALQVNNWNEERKAEKSKRYSLESVQSELVYNIETLRSAIEDYAQKDSIFQDMRGKDLAASDFIGNGEASYQRALYSRRIPVLRHEAYDGLLDHPELNPGEYISILNDLNDLSDTFWRLEYEFQQLEERVRENEEYQWKNYGWKSSAWWNEGQLSEEQLDYLANDSLSLNWIAEFSEKTRQILYIIQVYIGESIGIYDDISAELGGVPYEQHELTRDKYPELSRDELLQFSGTFLIQEEYGFDSTRIYLSEQGVLKNSNYRGGVVIYERDLRVRNGNVLEFADSPTQDYTLNKEGDLDYRALFSKTTIFPRIR